MKTDNPIMEILKEKNEYSLFDIFPMQTEKGTKYSFIELYNDRKGISSEYIGDIQSASKFYLYNRSGLKSLTPEICINMNFTKLHTSIFPIISNSVSIPSRLQYRDREVCELLNKWYIEYKKIDIGTSIELPNIYIKKEDGTIIDNLYIVRTDDKYIYIYSHDIGSDYVLSLLEIMFVITEKEANAYFGVSTNNIGSNAYIYTKGANSILSYNSNIAMHLIIYLMFLQSYSITDVSAYFKDYEYIDTTTINYIFDYMHSSYSTKWEKLYSTYSKEFDELNPYKMAIIDETTDHVESTDINAYNYNDSGNSSVNTDTNSTGNSNTYGVNSSAIPQTDNSRNDNTSATQSDSSNGNSNTNRNYNRDNSFNRNLSRVGNIGNKTYAELILEKRQFLQDRMSEQIFNDFDEVFTRQKYIL